jgi:lipid-binding SYLF domain-containing protein
MLVRAMEEFEHLRGIALAAPCSQAGLRYARGARKAASSRAQQMSQLAAAARAKHRGLFARVAPAQREC